MYNLIYITDEYNEGDMFDRFGRNSMYARDIFVYNLLSVDDVDETLTIGYIRSEIRVYNHKFLINNF